MTTPHSELLKEAEEIISFAETIESRIQNLHNRLHRIRFRIYVMVTGASFGVALGFSLATLLRKSTHLDSEWITSPAVLLSVLFFLTVLFSGSIVYIGQVFSEEKFLKKELFRERSILSKLVALADKALGQMNEEISLSQRALLETRLQRISFEQL